MLHINCPWCGPRSEVEFEWGGEAHLRRPGPHTDVTSEEWAHYLFYRNNPKGKETERWVHRHGCGQWFNIERDTVTHTITRTYKMTDPIPQTEEANND